MAVNSIRSSNQLNKILEDQKKTLEKLSSGKRINRASDDPAGLAIADSLQASVAALGQASRNISDSVSASQIADGSLSQVAEIGSRLKELATQSSNGTLSDTQRQALSQEYSALTQEIQRITATTEFNGKNLLNGESISTQVGTDSSAGSQIELSGTNISSTVSDLSSQNIGTQAGAQAALAAVDTFITAVSSSRGALGASAARIEFAGNAVATEKENSAAAEARIRDLDIAEGVTNKIKNDILSNSNVAINAQANQSSKLILKLLA